MMNAAERQEILAKGKPEPRDVPWWGEPNFGAWYTEVARSGVRKPHESPVGERSERAV